MTAPDPTDLPPGWEWAELVDLLREPLINGRSVKTMPGGFPVLRLTALKSGDIDYSESKEGAWSAEQASPFLVTEGDFLLSRGNGSRSLVGRGSIAGKPPFEAAFPDTMIRVRVDLDIISIRYLKHIWDSTLIRNQIEKSARTTAGIYKINQDILQRIQLPLPPLAEQHQIVETLEEHFSHLDAASITLEHTKTPFIQLRRSMLSQLRNRAIGIGAAILPLKTVANTALGKMLDSKRNSGIATPYLRNINVRWGSFDLEDVSTVPMPPEQAKQYGLAAGDLLVCEGGEPGRCAVWPGSNSTMTFQKALHRIRPSTGVSPHWIALMLEESVRNGRTTHMITGTTIKHFPQERLRQLEIPIPSHSIQLALVEEFSSAEIRLQRLQRAALAASTREQHLRSALLMHAFSGRLVAQDPEDEPAGVLLERIRAERAAQGGKTRQGGKGRRATPRPRKQVTVTEEAVPGPAAREIPPPRSSSPAPTIAIQQELF